MAYLFQLTIECAEDKEAALRVEGHFEGQAATLEGGESFRFQLDDLSQDERGRWWVSIILGNGTRFLQYTDSSTLLAEAAKKLYERLKSVQGYRFAVTGCEANQFNYVEALPELLDHPGMRGLVVSDELFQTLGKPKEFVRFSPGYFWLPSDYKYGG